jgi:PAS domain-containing protein
MSLPDAFQAFLAAGIGVIAAALLFVWWTRATAAPAVAARRLLADSAGKTALILAGDRLVDATPEGRALLRQAREGSTDWDRLVSALAPRFPDLRRQCADLAMTGRESIAADNDPDTLVEATYRDGVVRLELRAGAARTDPAERLIVAAMEQELTLLRNIGDNAPQLIWQCDRDGQVTWANRAYLDLADRAFPAEGDTTLTWPPPDLFSDLPLPEDSAPVVEHNWLSSAGTIAPQCYEITSVHRDPGTMHYSVDIIEVVEAREDQKTFVQTLTKTFAQLSVGLAIFDRTRRLARQGRGCRGRRRRRPLPGGLDPAQWPDLSRHRSATPRRGACLPVRGHLGGTVADSPVPGPDRDGPGNPRFDGRGRRGLQRHRRGGHVQPRLSPAVGQRRAPGAGGCPRCRTNSLSGATERRQHRFGIVSPPRPLLARTP